MNPVAISPDTLYPESVAIIRSRVYHVSRQWCGQVDPDELMSAAHEIFLQAVKTWAPSKALFTTHLYTQLGRLSDTARKESKHHQRFPSATVLLDHQLSFPDDQTANRPPPRSRLPIYQSPLEDKWVFSLETDSLEEEPPQLGADASTVLRMLLGGALDPDEGAGRKNRPNLSRAIARMRSAGWAPARTTSAWNEVTQWYRAGGCLADLEVVP